MPDATFTTPDLTMFARLDELGLVVVGQRLEPGRAVLACRVSEPDEWCRRCGCEGSARGSLGPASGARAVRVASDNAGGEGASLPLHRLRTCLATRHQRGGGAAHDGGKWGAARRRLAEFSHWSST
jgi:hypothetical protein